MKPRPDRIVLTRTRQGCTEWASELEALGAVPVILPCIRCRDLATPELRARLAREWPHLRWVAFTSRRGVAAFDRLGPESRAARIPVQVAAVGPATAAEARMRLGRVDLVGTGGTADALAAELVPRLEPGARVLIAVAETAGRALESALDRSGHPYLRMELYRTAPVALRPCRLAASALGARIVFLASPSAVTGFCNQVRLDAALAIFTIGPSTTRAARAAGLQVAGEAARPGLPGLLEALQCAN